MSISIITDPIDLYDVDYGPGAGCIPLLLQPAGYIPVPVHQALLLYSVQFSGGLYIYA